MSSGFRTLTGVIVTVLVVLFVILIGTTLARYPMGEVSQAGDMTEGATPPAASSPTSGVVANDAEPTPAETTAPAPAESTSVFAVTIQPTATREPRVVLDTPTPTASATPTAPPGLPTPNPEATIAAPVLVYANANWVNDVAYAGTTLWAATSGGAVQWRADGAEPRVITAADGLGATFLTAVADCALEDFGVIFGSDHGLQVYSPDAQTWKQIRGGGAALRYDDVTALACDVKQGVLAVGYGANGVDVFRAQPGRWSNFEPDEGFAEQPVTALAIAENGVVWAASGGSLAQLTGSRVRLITPEDSPLTGEIIGDLAVDDDNALWLTSGERLYRLSGSTWSTYAASKASGDFPAGALVSVAPAQGGRVWVAAADASLCRFDPEFESCAPYYAGAEGMVLGPLTSMAVGSGGALAYGTRGQGSSAYARSGWAPLTLDQSFPVANRVFALASDANGFVWAATNGGVHQFDPGDPQVNALFTADSDGITTSNVRTLYADNRGGVWLGGIGASYFDGVRWTNYTQADGLAGDEITAIAEDSQRRIWFGTRTGLSIWTGTTFFNLTSENGLPDAEILSLAVEGDGMWIGSAGGGLYRFENNQLQVLTSENVGLPSNRITALLARDGSLFVGTDRGLARLEQNRPQPVEGMDAQRITSLASGGGLLWAGTTEDGAYSSADGVAWQRAESDDTALPNSVRAVTVDLYGGAWLGTEAAGLTRYQAR